MHVEVHGEGIPAVFVHGSFGWGSDTFPGQREVADGYRSILVDRRGFGASPRADVVGWPMDAEDLASLLDDLGSAHLVGHSYGAVVCLLAAGLHPDRVRSLVAIEPPAFEHAKGNEEADAVTAALRPVYERATELTDEEFVIEWSAELGNSEDAARAWMASFGEQDWAAARSSRLECWPGDAPFDFDALADARFPKVIVRGEWPAGRERAGRVFRAVCERIAERIGATVAVFEGSSHNPQLQEPERFNALLREVWSAADRDVRSLRG